MLELSLVCQGHKLSFQLDPGYAVPIGLALPLLNPSERGSWLREVAKQNDGFG